MNWYNNIPEGGIWCDVGNPDALGGYRKNIVLITMFDPIKFFYKFGGPSGWYECAKPVEPS